MRVVGDYEVSKTLGAGSFGKVKLGKQILTGLPVALKLFQISKVVTAEQWSRVHREILLLKQVDHPNITKFFDVIQTDHHIILITELLDNGELFDYIIKNKCAVPENEARKFFQQLISAVDYCHKRGIVHRDLKPENLLLDSHNNLKIADFGLSNIMRDGDFLQTSCGSPNYAAPEVIDGAMYNGPEVDVWSCGVILYILLVGHLPFDNQHIPSLFRQIRSARYTLPALMRRDAKELIQGILVANMHNRMTIEQIRQSPWFLRDLPDNLRTAPTTPALQRTMRQLNEETWLGRVGKPGSFKPAFVNKSNEEHEGDHEEAGSDDEDHKKGDMFLETEETDMGEIDMRAVDELVTRAEREGGVELNTDAVVASLQDGAKVKKIRIGYLLCKEYLRYQEMNLREQFAQGLGVIERSKAVRRIPPQSCSWLIM
ncbi:Pkinase-domain-containing protein [Atractiella rhizophila]|nr:Pkinase-domain-containing protein [Atractiella rhizophila]